ncbi:MAG: peptidoglycan binding domain-containing protein [Lachnospiraceae bacterium]|nr:peptidoglycan binding domain-containing protein [Lachnospiraceae bacterium]
MKLQFKNREKTEQNREGTGKRRKLLIAAVLVLTPLLVLLVVYMAGLGRYQSCFLNGTVIDKVDVSGMSIPELEERIGRYSLRVIERQADGTTLEEEILGSEIGISYVSTEPLEAVLQGQNRYLWFLKQDADYRTDAPPFYEETALEEKINALRGFQRDFIKEPTDAYIADYVSGSGFELVAETKGNRLNRDKALEAIRTALNGLEEQVDLDAAGCYEEPGITTEDAGLKATYEKLQNYVNTAITYTFGTERESLDADTVAGWIIRRGNRVELDPELVKEYVNSLRKKYDTVFHKRKFQTSYGQEVTIDLGDYGWWMDVGQETEELIGLLEKGEGGERIPVYRQTAASYDDPDYGDSYVEINLTAQHLFLYQNGACVLESDFVSGNPNRGNETPPGIYGITYKERNATLNGETYSTPVSFWMPFNNNVGMHDATWRSEFGRNIYLTNGSHGCVNLPYSVAQEIYGYVEKNTPVICYYLPGTEPEPLPEIPLELEPENVTREGGPAMPEAGVPVEPAVLPEPVPQPETVPQPEPGWQEAGE